MSFLIDAFSLVSSHAFDFQEVVLNKQSLS